MTSTCSRVSYGAVATFRGALKLRPPGPILHREAGAHGLRLGDRDFPAGAPRTGPGVKVRGSLPDGDITQVFTSGLQGEGRGRSTEEKQTGGKEKWSAWPMKWVEGNNADMSAKFRAFRLGF